jgi:hypothetical protein
MQAVRDKWTDERLDDMNGRMSEGFGRVDADLREIRSDMRGLRSDMNSEFVAVRNEMSDRFDSTQRLIVQIGAGLFGTMAVGFLGMVLTLLFTQH